MSLTGAIASLSSGTYTITRKVKGTYDSFGVYTVGSTSTFDIIASIQPNTGGSVTNRDLQSTAPSQRVDSSITIFSTTEILSLSPDTQPDVIHYDGLDWEVYTSDRWEAFGEIWWRAAASKVTPP